MLSNIPVFFEDEWLAVFNKPPGLLTVPAPGNTSRSLTQILNEDLERQGVSFRLHPCHRLDKETSGLILYAKGKSAQDKLMQLFKGRKISKTYIAFVHGRVEQDKGLITRPIEGQAASTRFEVLERCRDFSVVELSPETGRTNQIRIHFKAIGHPLVGESKFTFRRDFALRSKRVCLHATHLEFLHPWTNKVIAIESPLARDMQKFLEDHRDPSNHPSLKKNAKA
jgi:23S rRNA pseudouridine1911/1915/1917 synthase